MYKLDIGTSLNAVKIACTLLSGLATSAEALSWVTLDLVARGRIALLWYWASHRGSSRTITGVVGTVRGGAMHGLGAV